MERETGDRVLVSAGKVGRNAALLFLGNAAAGICGVIYTLIVARVLGPESYGVYAGAIATATIAGLLLNSGPAYLITREIAQGVAQAGKIASEISFGAIFPIVLSILFALVLAWQAPSEALRAVIPVAVIAVAARATWRLYCAVFEGKENMAWTTLSGVLQAVLPLCAVPLILLPAFRKPIFVVAIEGTSALIIVGILLLALKRVFKFSLRKPTLEELLSLARGIWPFWIIVASSLVILQADVFILSWSKLPAQTIGYYRAAVNFISMTEIVPSMLAIALYPTISRFINDPAMLQAFLWRSFKNSALLGIGVALAVGTVAGPLVRLAYGDAYGEAGRVVLFLAPAIALKYQLYILSLSLYAARKERMLVVGMICAAGLSVALNIVLISKYGGIGAAIASVATNLILVAWFFRMVTRNIAPVAVERLALPVAAAIAGYAAIVCLVPINIWAKMALGIIVFVVALIATGGIDSLDLAGILRTVHIKISPTNGTEGSAK